MAEEGVACGLTCDNVEQDYTYGSINLYNSLSQGKVSGVEAYGVINKLKRPTIGYTISLMNIIVFAEINGTSKAYSFTDDEKTSLSNSYTLQSLCKNCENGMIIAKRDDGQYYTINHASFPLTISYLNLIAIRRGWEMVWSEKLELIPMLWISFGSPLNDIIKIGPGVSLNTTLSGPQKEKISGYLLAKNESHVLVPLDSGTFTKNTHIILCYSMTCKNPRGTDSVVYLENNKPIKDYTLFASLVLALQVGIVDYYDSSIVYELDHIMTKNLTVAFVNKLKVEFGLPVNKTVYVYPGNKMSTAAEMAEFSLDDYILVNKSSGQELNGDTVIESDIIVELWYQVTAEGAYEGSWVVESGSTLGSISELEPYFGEGYVVVDAVDLSVVDKGTVVNKKMRLHVSESSQEVSVKIGSPVDRTVHVNVGTRLGDISALKPYFVDGYSVVSGWDSSVVYTEDTVVTGDMFLSIVEKWVVVIEITPTDATLVDESEIERMLKNLDGGADVSVASKVEDGKVTQLEVTVDSKEAADMIVRYLDELDKGEGCHAGILCKVEHAYVVGAGGLSQGSWHSVSAVALAAALLCVLF